MGVIAAVWIYRLQQNKKSLSYEILASNALLTASEEIRGRIKISFDRKPVQNVYLLVMKFTNDGNVPILPSDFYENIKINFGEQTQILSGDVVEHYPETFEPLTVIEGISLSILPTLINSHDSFTIKFLLAQYTKDGPKVTGRIAGVKIVVENTRRVKTWKRLQDVSAMIFVLSLVFSIITAMLAPEVNSLIFLTLVVSASLFYGIEFSGKVPKEPGKQQRQKD
jgi:hypothetical protein